MPPAELLRGRRLYFVGIGGSGMAAYANIARSLGADVRGWEARDTIFLRSLADISVDLGGDPVVPVGYEAVVSSAHTGRVPDGIPRAQFLAELVESGPSIVVGGAHGKTTTAAMIAFVLRETGRDPSFIIGGVVPQLGGNAGAGSGWLVVEGDESDRSIGVLRPTVGAVTNIELDHHAAYASTAELELFFEAWLGKAGHAIRGWSLAPAEVELALAGAHNQQNAAVALAALALAGVSEHEAAPVLARFRGVDRRFQVVGVRAGVTVVDDYGHNPTELATTIRAARSKQPARVIAVYQPHVYERTRQLHRELGAALGLADAAIVTDVIDGRDTPLPGITGKLVVDALPPGTRAAWAPSQEDAVAMALAWVRPGDLVITFGVGEPWKIAHAVVAGLTTREG